jgi:serine/threonine protein kinase
MKELAPGWRLDLGIRLMKQIASGMCHVHAHDVVHGDLKLKNILIDEAGKIGFADFF